MVQELFFEVIRKKQHIFCDAKDNTQVSELKKIVEGILNVPISDIVLIKFNEEGSYTSYSTLDDKKNLSECGFSSANAKAQAPAQIGLLLRGDSDFLYEELSTPPPVPENLRSEHPQE